MRHLLPRLQARADVAIAISRAVASDMDSVLPGLPVEVVLNGIRTEDFERGRVPPLDLDGLAGLPPVPAARIGLIATYAHWKGHEIFLEAAAPHKTLRRRATIQSWRGRSIRRARASSASPSFDSASGIFASRTVSAFFRFSANQHACTPHWTSSFTPVRSRSRSEEPSPEGMAAGCALVASAEAAHSSRSRNGVDGLLVKPRDVETLTSSLRRLVRESGLTAGARKQCGRTGTERPSRRSARPENRRDLRFPCRPLTRGRRLALSGGTRTGRLCARKANAGQMVSRARANRDGEGESVGGLGREGSAQAP
jgi:hypothetical protein